MALQNTKEGTRRTKREPGNHVVPGVKDAAKKNRRTRSREETIADYADHPSWDCKDPHCPRSETSAWRLDVRLHCGYSTGMNIEHRFPVGAPVEVRPYLSFQPWKRATVQRHEPYRGRPGYYVSYTDAKEQWDCHGGWVAEYMVRPVSA